jgi:uncharacterized membrane protein YdbT with pleckstrin-like domain
MDNNIDNQTIKDQNYQTLGKKVLWLFFFQVSPIAFIILIISIIIFILSFQPFLTNTPLGNIQNHTLQASLIIFAISFLLIIISLAYARLTYMNYRFSMADDSFKIKRGILNKTENAIPYRQIQNVDIEQGLLFQMLGLSRLIILTAGHEDENPKGAPSETDEAEGVIPAIDQKLAEWLQTELLKRAEVQKVEQTA